MFHLLATSCAIIPASFSVTCETYANDRSESLLKATDQIRLCPYICHSYRSQSSYPRSFRLFLGFLEAPIVFRRFRCAWSYSDRLASSRRRRRGTMIHNRRLILVPRVCPHHISTLSTHLHLGYNVLACYVLHYSQIESTVTVRFVLFSGNKKM
jgi:hypothetical protein